MSKVEKLQEIVNELSDREKHGELFIEYRPGRGYWLVGEARYVFDDGDFLGTNYDAACSTIQRLL